LWRFTPTYGVFQALSIIGGVLAVIALVLISAAMIVGRASAGNEKVTATLKTIEVPLGAVPLSVTPTLSSRHLQPPPQLQEI
jgi:hypothetical protein